MRIASVRIARATDRLDEVVAFHRDVLGLAVIGGFEDHDGYSGVMLGLPGERVHLEFTTHRDGSPAVAGGDDDLLVLYVDPPGLAAVLGRAERAGLTAVAPANPYWDAVGAIALPDPDGRLVVLVPDPPSA